MRSRKSGVHAQSYIDMCDLSTLHKYLSQDTPITTMGTLVRASIKMLLATLEANDLITRDTDPVEASNYLLEKGMIKTPLEEIAKSNAKKVSVTKEILEKARGTISEGEITTPEKNFLTEEEQESIRRRYREVYGD